MSQKNSVLVKKSTNVRLKKMRSQSFTLYKNILSLSINSVSFVNKDIAANLALNVWGKVRISKFRPRGVFGQVKPIFIDINNRKIAVYRFGKGGKKKVLLSPGWEGQASDFYKIVPFLVEEGYEVITFDGPAHGLSSGTHTNIFEFSETIIGINEVFGNFDIAIGHSLGGAATVIANHLENEFNPKKIITMGSPNKLAKMVKNFSRFLSLRKDIYRSLIKEIEKRSNLKVEQVSIENYLSQSKAEIMIIHDEDDNMVSFDSAKQIIEKVKVSEFLVTKKLGHIKILRDQSVITQVLKFI